MKIHRRSFINGIILVGIGGGGALGAAQPTDEYVTCAAWINNTQLKLDGRFRLTAAIECKKGIRFVYAPINFGALGFSTSIRTAGGDLVSPPFELSAHPFATRFLSDSRDFLKLYAGMLEGAYIERDVRDFFPAVGVYTLSVSYRSPIVRAATAVPDAIVREDGPIFSSPLNIQVS